MTEPWWTMARWLIVTLFAMVAIFVGDPVVRRVFHLARDPLAPSGEEVPLVESAAGTLRGGWAIGVLERLGLYATLMAAFPAGIAVIIAVKGLARYPDLKASDGTAERFILGTFTSLLVAAAAAGMAHWLIDLLPRRS